MAITSSLTAADGSIVTNTFFAGRVLKVETSLETRNHSDTLDYTDMRTTECTYALVWLGTHGYAPCKRGGRRAMVDYSSLRNDPPSQYGSQPRDLAFWEQFAWVDCTNLFVWRGGYHWSATVDASPADGVEPLMWANYHAWMAIEAALTDKLAAERKAADELRAAEQAKAAAKAAAAAAKDDALRAAVEAKMASTPAKGTLATVDGFTGKVFWKGVKKYRGKWKGTVALKNAKGDVSWVDVSHWVP